MKGKERERIKTDVLEGYRKPVADVGPRFLLSLKTGQLNRQKSLRNDDSLQVVISRIIYFITKLTENHDRHCTNDYFCRY